MLVWGITFFIQNAYVLESTPLSVFRQWETWVLIHAFIPMFIRLFTGFKTTMAICYSWESAEVIFGIPSGYRLRNAILIFLSEWTGRELPSDSLILDILMGASAAIWMGYFLHWSGIENGYFWNIATIKRRILYVVIIIVMGLSALLSTLHIMIDPTKPMYANTLEEFSNNPINVIAAGMYPWLILQLILIQYLKILLKSNSSKKNNIDCLFDYVQLYLGFHGIITAFFIMPTFYSYWLSTPLFILLIQLK